MNASLCDSAPWGIIKSCVKPVRVDRKCLKIKTVFFALMYEFTEKENTSFLLLRRSLSLAFVTIMLLGVLDALTLIFSKDALHDVELIVGIFVIVLMVWASFRFASAYQRITKIITTKGDDISNLMGAVKQLNSTFFGIFILIAGHIVGTFFFHEMMYGPYSILNDMFFSLPKDPAAMPMN